MTNEPYLEVMGEICEDDARLASKQQDSGEVTDGFKVGVGQSLSPLLFAVVMEELTSEVRQECQWTMMLTGTL